MRSVDIARNMQGENLMQYGRVLTVDTRIVGFAKKLNMRLQERLSPKVFIESASSASSYVSSKRIRK